MDDEDMDFTPTHGTSSKLASLFGMNKPAPSGNASLIYTAPKQPKKEDSPSRTPPSEANKPALKLEVILTKGVQAYKLENGSYNKQGTVGITIIGNFTSHIYQIIIYNKDNKQHISKSRISKNFSFSVLDNNYGSFYDDARQNWSLMFASASDIQQFAKQVAISKFNCQIEPADDILIQDLSPVVLPGAQYSNFLNVAYSSYLLINDELKPLNERSSQIVQLTEKNEMPWLKGLVGCSEKCRRIIILPYSLSAPWTNEIPPNSNLLIEVDVGHFSLANSVKSSPAKKTRNVEDSGESPVDSSAEESTVKSRGVSIKEALSSTKSHKANLISRMARMGQATLPLKGAIPCGPSDSEEESSTSLKSRTSRVKTPAVSNFQSAPNAQIAQLPEQATQSVAVYQNDLHWQTPQMMRSGLNAVYPHQQLIPVSVSPLTSPTTDSTLSVYLSESRTQAAEIRMGISKVSDKVDQVISKLQEVNLGGTDRPKLYQSPMLDPTGILTGIQALVAENESLKSKVEEQKTKIEQQNDRIYHLLELNHKYLEQNSTTRDKQSETEIKLQSQVESYKAKESQMEENNRETMEKMKSLENELSAVNKRNEDLKEEMSQLNLKMNRFADEKESNETKLKENNSRIPTLEKDLSEALETKKKLGDEIADLKNYKSEIDARNVELSCELESCRNEIKVLKMQSEEMQKTISALRTVNEKSEDEVKTNEDGEYLKENLEKLSLKIKQLEEEKEEILGKSQKSNKADDSDVVEELKTVMNAVYKNLQSLFDASKEYNGASIKQILGTTIRNVTLEYLERQKEKIPTKTVRDETRAADAKEATRRTQAVGGTTDLIQKKEVIDERSDETKSDDVEIEESTLREIQETSTAQKESEFDVETENYDKIEEQSSETTKLKTENENMSYDQNWRLNKPPPPPLFDDEDDDDDWLS